MCLLVCHCVPTRPSRRKLAAPKVKTGITLRAFDLAQKLRGASAAHSKHSAQQTSGQKIECPTLGACVEHFTKV